MTTLEALSETPEVSLEDLAETQDSVSVNNRASNINLAAHTALLSENPDEVVTNFQDISAEMDLGENSPTADELVQRVQARTQNITRQVVLDALADPEVSDEQKQGMVQAFQEGFSVDPNLREMIATEAIIAESAGATVESENIFVSMSDAVSTILETKKQRQAMLNAAVAETDFDGMQALAQAVELLIPFDESIRTGNILGRLREGDGSAYREALFAMGSKKQEIVNWLHSASPEDQLKITQAIIDAVNANAAIALPDTNDFIRVNFLRSFLEDGYYTTFDKWVDNAVSVLDLVMLGGIFKAGARSAAATSSEISKAKRAMIRSTVQPTSPSQTIKDFNPGKARSMHEAASASEEASEALYATNKTESVAHEHLPEVASPDGSVAAKVPNPGAASDQQNTTAAALLEFVDQNGLKMYFEQEKATARAAVVNDFHNAKGLQTRINMGQIEDTETGVNIRQYYGPSQSGFSNPWDARAMVQWSLRDYNIPDDAITLMRRHGDEYLPTTEAEIRTVGEVKEVLTKGKKRFTGKKGKGTVRVVTPPDDYIVRVDYAYRVNPADVVKYAETDVKWNLFDRVPQFANWKSGSLQRHAMDAHSMLHPKLTFGANVAVEKGAALEKRLLDVGADFSDAYIKLGKDEQQLVGAYIKEANAKGLAYDYTNLVARGFKQNQIDAVKSWRDYWDSVYWLDNADFVKTLRSRGHQVLVNEGSDTRLFAKPIAKHSAGKSVRVYDTTSGEIITKNAAELDELYDTGGTVAHLSQPLKVGDEAAEFVIANNTANGSYLRKLGDHDQALNYRPGYYSVHYKDPHFIVQVIRDSKGNKLYEKAIATAGTSADADLMVRRMAATGGEFFRREDFKGLDVAKTRRDVDVATGRSSQRIRGKRLEDATSHITDASMEHILDPIDSLIHAARSVSDRVSMRDYLEASKRRYISQYGNFLEDGKFGQKQWPTESNQIVKKTGTSSDKDIADARTTWEYINYMEHGYRNAIDDGWKATLKSIADIAGNNNWSKAEKSARWLGDQRGPTGFAKNAAFNLYLALNPLRQFIVQSHQATQLFVNFPKYSMGGGLAMDTALLTKLALNKDVSPGLLKMAGKTKDEALLMWKQLEDSGVIAGIDRQNLIRGSLDDIAEMSLRTDKGNLIQRGTAYASKGVEYSRKAGFDAGESINMMTAWLSYRNKAIQQGKALTPGVLDDITAQARNYTYNMNRAGDMPYNQNALAVLFQFMQVPHKALLGTLTNRSLSGAERARLFTYNAFAFSLPPAFMYEFFGHILSEDPEIRDMQVQGLEGYMLNKMLTMATGEKTSLDFSSLSAIDAFGTGEMVYGLMTTDAGAILAGTPSGKLFLGNNPRVTEAWKEVARYTNLIEDSEQTPTTFSQTVERVASLASGMSNAFKARYAVKAGQKINSMGGITDSNVTTVEGVAAAFGFSTLAEAQGYWVSDKAYRMSKEFKDDVNLHYREFKKRITRAGITNAELDFTVGMYSEFWRVYGNDNQAAKNIFDANLKRDAKGKDLKMINSAIRSSGLMMPDETRKLFMALPISEEERKPHMETMDFIDALRGAQ